MAIPIQQGIAIPALMDKMYQAYLIQCMKRHESEYQTRPPHKNLTSKTAESGELMAGRAVRVGKVKGLSGKEYTLHLEFAGTSRNAGEEIRTLLREKVITETLQSPDTREDWR